MNKTKNQLGFSTKKVILVLVVIALAVVAGLMIRNTRTKSLTTTSGTNTNSSTQGSKAAMSSANVATTPAKQLLMTFYQKYSTVDLKNAPAITLSDLVKQYGTAKLSAFAGKLYVEDPILCAQAQPSTIAVSDPAPTNTGVSAVVTEQFGLTTVKVNTTVVNESGTLKIDTVTCTPKLIEQHPAAH